MVKAIGISVRLEQQQNPVADEVSWSSPGFVDT
jgi:hypothetical protein